MTIVFERKYRSREFDKKRIKYKNLKMSILISFSEEEKQQLTEFLQVLEEKRILNEISKLKFGRAHVARFLYSQQF